MSENGYHLNGPPVLGPPPPASKTPPAPELRAMVPYRYSNVVQCALMELDFRLAFGDQGPMSVVNPIAGIVFHPVMAKRFLHALAELIGTYEVIHGPIKDDEQGEK